MDKKTKALLTLFVILVAITISATLYKYLILKDYYRYSDEGGETEFSETITAEQELESI